MTENTITRIRSHTPRRNQKEDENMKTKIEFRDFRLPGRNLGIEIMFYVENVMEFLKWCGATEHSIRLVEAAGKKRGKNPSVKIYEYTRYEVYPRKC